MASSSSSSLTLDLFGPKTNSSSSSNNDLFGSVFPPQSTAPGRSFGQSGPIGSSRKQDKVNQVGSPKQGAADNYSRNSNSQNNGTEPCYFNSSIYYGGQQVYSPNNPAADSLPIFTKDGGDDDANGTNSNAASRGNWWQGSLYY